MIDLRGTRWREVYEKEDLATEILHLRTQLEAELETAERGLECYRIQLEKDYNESDTQTIMRLGVELATEHKAREEAEHRTSEVLGDNALALQRAEAAEARLATVVRDCAVSAKHLVWATGGTQAQATDMERHIIARYELEDGK